MPSPDPTPESLALIELSSIGRGARVLDTAAKKAEVTVHTAEPVSSGKYLLVFTGAVAAVEESFRAGVSAGGDAVLNKLLLWQVDPQVVRAFQHRVELGEPDALAVVETTSLSSAVSAADAAVKAADVILLELRLGHGIGGKGVITLAGVQHDLEAGVAAAVAVCEREGTLAGVEIINRPHADLVETLVRGANRSPGAPWAPPLRKGFTR